MTEAAVELDSKAWALLMALQADGRAPLKTLASAAGLSVPATVERLKRLKDAIRVLENVKDIAICRLTAADVVRHALVQEIISAYEKADKVPAPKKPRQLTGRYKRKN